MSLRPRRSVLYMPGANARALEKARSLAADSLILDLEDSVASEAKSEARDLVAQNVAAGGYGKRELIIRVNGLDTIWAEDDLSMAANSAADAILIPKVNGPEDLQKAARLARGKPLWAMMESPRAVLQALAIADSRLASCFIIGTNDLLKETRMAWDGARLALIPALSQILMAGRAAGLDVIDGVYNDFRNEAGFLAECTQARLLGMDGKTLIHPGQLGPANAIFAPSADEIAAAERIIAGFAAPDSQGKGVISLDGRMVERLHLEMAERTVQIARAIAALEG